MSYTKKVIKGAGAVFFFLALSSVIGYISRYILTQRLSVEEYGLFYAVFTFVNFFALFRDLGLGNSLVKYLAEYKAREEHHSIKTAITYVFTIQLFVTVAIAAVLAFFSQYLSDTYFGTPLAKPILLILVGWLVLSSFQNAIFQTFYGTGNITIYSFKPFVNNLVYLIGLIVFLSLGFGVQAAAWAWLVATVALIIIFTPILLATYNIFTYKFYHSKKIIKDLVLFGIPSLLNIIGAVVIGYIDTIFLTFFRSLHEVGVYNVVLPTATLFLFFGRSIATAIFPVSSELWAKKEIRLLREAHQKMQKYVFIIILPVVMALITFSSLFLGYLFGVEYQSGSRALQILLVGIAVFTLASINNTLLNGMGKPHKVTKIIMVSAFINVVFNLVLIPLFGITGAAVSTTISYIAAYLYSVKEIHLSIDTSFNWSALFKTLMSGIIFVFLATLAKTILVMHPLLELLIGLVIAGGVYVALLFSLRVLNKQEILQIVNNVLK